MPTSPETKLQIAAKAPAKLTQGGRLSLKPGAIAAGKIRPMWIARNRVTVAETAVIATSDGVIAVGEKGMAAGENM